MSHDLTDRILQNLTQDLDILIESISASNSLKTLSLNDNHRSNLDDSNQSQTDTEFNQLLIDVTNRLNDIFEKYFIELKKHFERIEQFNKKFPNSNNLDDLIDYQRSILIEKLTDKHYDLLVFLFKSLFDYYHKINEEEDEQNEINLDNLRSEHDLINKFLNINQILFNLGLFDHLCGDVVVGVVEDKIRQHIDNTSIDNYEESFIDSFKEWLNKIILGWIRLIYSTQTNLEHLEDYKKQLLHFMYTNYAHCRIRRLFEIVIDFPDSKNAVQDLKICLNKTNLRSHLIKTLTYQIDSIEFRIQIFNKNYHNLCFFFVCKK
ncbi:unnamed protein product [Brachionus calyciflorus]|uniref:Anaphase-promoting complex subunit 2 TPR repeats domain-containing protein n=1 Tax=Brachionus calyciflorus TaxID=104777 RepID=A0A814KBM9_9BILA|nr:unnamed protein product [Brachionus calyciflorus]